MSLILDLSFPAAPMYLAVPLLIQKPGRPIEIVTNRDRGKLHRPCHKMCSESFRACGMGTSQAVPPPRWFSLGESLDTICTSSLWRAAASQRKVCRALQAPGECTQTHTHTQHRYGFPTCILSIPFASQPSSQPCLLHPFPQKSLPLGRPPFRYPSSRAPLLHPDPPKHPKLPPAA